MTGIGRILKFQTSIIHKIMKGTIWLTLQL